MSGVAAVNSILSADADVTSIVPAERVITGDIRAGEALPAICIKQISSVKHPSIDMGSTTRTFRLDRVRVTVHTKVSYEQKAAILTLIGVALVGKKRTVGSIWVDSILPEGQGPDFDDTAAKTYERSEDYMVKWVNASVDALTMEDDDHIGLENGADYLLLEG
jgi:hypothetical protein